MGIQAKLFLPILFGCLCLWVIVHFFWGPGQLEEKHISLEESGRDMLVTMAPGVARSLLGGDLASLYGTLNQQMEAHKEHWIQLGVHNKNDKQIYPLKKLMPANGPNTLNLTHEIEWSGEFIGKITLDIDITKEINGERQHIAQLEYLSLLVFGVIGVIAAIWQHFTIIRPVLLLKEAASELAQGNYQHQLPKAGRDEVGELTSNFGIMKNNLQVTQNELHQAVKKAQTQATYQETVFNNIADGIIILDNDGNIESLNPAAETIFGFSSNEVVGKPIFSLLDLTPSNESIRVVNLNAGRVEVNGLHRNKYTFPLELSINEMMIGDQPKLTAIARDITERHRVDKMKNEFVSTVSHELRTPLTSISGALKLITGGAVGPIPEQLKELLRIANDNTTRLLRLINDILDIQKIEAGKMDFKFQKTEILPILKLATEANEHYASQLQVNLQLNKDSQNALIMADPDRIQQVLNNLISNALKFSPKEETVEISSIRQNNKIRIQIMDHGPGIPEDFRDKLFDQFTQSDSSDTRKAGGTGLGLSITKAIVKKHCGEIGFETKMGIGTTFHIDLPIAYQADS